MRFGSLFSGAGLGDYGAELAGWASAFQVELDPFCRTILARHWPDVPKFGDIRTLDCAALPVVDALIGGFPCQDISPAGKGAGLAGPKSGLWREYARVIEAINPRWVIIENSGRLITRGLDVVLQDLAARGYDAEWDVVPAGALGAPHLRERTWVVAWQRVAYPDGPGRALVGRGGVLDGERTPHGDHADGRGAPVGRIFDPSWIAAWRARGCAGTWPRAESELGRAPDGRAARLDGRHFAEFPTPTASAYGASGNARGHPERRRLSLDSMARSGRWTQSIQPWERDVPRAIPSTPALSRQLRLPDRRRVLGNGMVPLVVAMLCSRITYLETLCS